MALIERLAIMLTPTHTARRAVQTALGIAIMLSPLVAACADADLRATAPAYRLEFLTGEDQDSQARNVNQAGTVAGTIAAPGQYWGQEVLWPLQGSPIPLEGVGAKAMAVNNRGVPAGYWQSGGKDMAVVWTQGLIQPLPLDGNPGAYAFGINDVGTVVGSLIKPNFDTVPSKWVKGQLQLLPVPDGATGRAMDINGRGQIAGEVGLNGPSYVTHAYLWTHPSAIDLHPAAYVRSTAWSVSSLGQVAGWATMAGTLEHAGIWRGRHFVDLNGQAQRSLAYGVNMWGQVVGEASLTPSSGNTAVLWDLRRGKEAIDLNVFLSPTDVQAGWRLIWAKAINDAGVIVGDAAQTGTSRMRAFRLIPLHHVAAPSTATSD